MTPLGDKILDEIIRQDMIQVEETIGDEDSAVLVWSGNAAEQLEAVVDRHYRPLIVALQGFLAATNRATRTKAAKRAKEALESI